MDPSFFDSDNGDPLGKEQLKGERARRVIVDDNMADPVVVLSCCHAQC